MSAFVDASAFLAVLDANDIEHEKAKKTWEHLITNNEYLLNNSGEIGKDW